MWCCSDLTKANLSVCVSQMHTDTNSRCKRSSWQPCLTLWGSNCTTLEVTGNGGEKKCCELRGDFWQFLENVAKVIIGLWWSAIWAPCWDLEMCGVQNKMFDALRWGGGSISVCQRYLRIILKIGSVGVLSELNDNLNLYLQTGWVQQNNEPVYQADDLL